MFITFSLNIKTALSIYSVVCMEKELPARYREAPPSGDPNKRIESGIYTRSRVLIEGHVYNEVGATRLSVTPLYQCLQA